LLGQTDVAQFLLEVGWMSAGYLGIRTELWQNVGQVTGTWSILGFPIELIIEVGLW